jgi:hypothetical protein
MKSIFQLIVGFAVLIVAAMIIWSMLGVILTVLGWILAWIVKTIFTVVIAGIAVITVIALIGAIFRS